MTDDVTVQCDLCSQGFPSRDLQDGGRGSYCAMSDERAEDIYILLRCAWCTSHTQVFTESGEA